MNLDYEGTATELERRIEALVARHPEILTLDSPFKLFSVEGFKCEDLQPSLAQASFALARVQARRQRSL